MSPEVRLAHVNFIKYIEEKFGGAKVERIDPGKYFGRAFEIWFKMITDGKSDQVRASLMIQFVIYYSFTISYTHLLYSKAKNYVIIQLEINYHIIV